MLPRTLPNVAGFRFGAGLQACQHLAGDFYNAFRLDHDRIGVYLGDVMGHGAAAALLGVYAMQVLRTKRIEGNQYEIIPPDVSLTELNRELLSASFHNEPFVTMIYGIFDKARMTWTYCCGGHPPALLLRPGQAPRKLEPSGPLLGVFDATFSRHEIELQPGDRLLLYSDGVDSVGWGEFGQGLGGLVQLLQSREGRPPQQLIDEALTLARHADHQLADDVTMLLTQVDG